MTRTDTQTDRTGSRVWVECHDVNHGELACHVAGIVRHGPRTHKAESLPQEEMVVYEKFFISFSLFPAMILPELVPPPKHASLR